MSRFAKLLSKFHADPKKLDYLEIEKILIYFGCIRISAKGSHVKFKHPLAKNDLVIPIHNNDCKDFYKKSALEFVKDNHLNINL